MLDRYLLVLLIIILVVILAAGLGLSAKIDSIGAMLITLMGGVNTTHTPPARAGAGASADGCKQTTTASDPTYYYHGSSTEIKDQLEPRPTRVLDGENAVFAANSMSAALMFIGKWNDEDIMFGTHDDVMMAIELRPGTFDKLRASGYIYYVDPAKFTSDPRLGMDQIEFISRDPVPIIKWEPITDAFECMKIRGEIKFITFERLMDAMRDLPPEPARS
jgi:hypothetical protein